MNMFESFLWKKTPEKIGEPYPTAEGIEVKDMTIEEIEAIEVAGNTGENNFTKEVFKVGRDLDANPGTIDWQDPDTIISVEEDGTPWLQGNRDQVIFHRENREQR